MSSEKKTSIDEEILHGSIPKVMFKLVVPAIVAQLVNAIYNLIDRMYIGRIPNVGDVALTGLGITFPIIIIISAFAVLVGLGGAPLASIKLGQGKKEKAEELLGNSFCMLLIFGILLTIGAFIFKDKLLYLFGASDITFPYADSYLTIYIIGTIFVMLSSGLNTFINSQGFAKMGMITILIGAVLNIILDPIFIFGFNMGIKGAALATVISQAVSAIWTVSFLSGHKTIIKIKKSYMKLKADNVKRILALGLSPFIMQSTESLVQIAFNTTLLKYGGDVQVGAMTVIISAMQIFNMPLLGITQGAQPLIGYNYGAKNFKRVKTAVKYSIIACMSLALVGWSLAQFAPKILIGIFTDSPELTAIATKGMRIFMAMVFMLGAQIACQNFFTAIGKAKISILLALLRKIVILIPLVYILPMFLGVNGIFIAEPVADFAAATTTIIVFVTQLKKLKKELAE